MSGICADANGDKGNDLETKSGKDVSQSEYKYSKVGNSYQVNDPEKPRLTKYLNYKSPAIILTNIYIVLLSITPSKTHVNTTNDGLYNTHKYIFN